MNDRWYELFVQRGAILQGHFFLSSGRHSGTYIQCAKVLEHPRDAQALGEALARKAAGRRVDRVISPPLGGILIGYEVARSLDRPFLFPERGRSGALTLRRGFTLARGERVLVVEDVVTTGLTTSEVVRLLERQGAEACGALALVDRTEDHAAGGLPLEALLHLPFPTYPPESCPLCAQGVPGARPGSRKPG
ncbi:MAG: orotate phosphoribosyltransferase [Candidatus Bipolaricaulaceae bacterium]